MFNKGDIVDWRVLGGGGPGYEMGTLRCKVVYTGTEVGLEPLSWDEAYDFFVPREISEEDWNAAGFREAETRQYEPFIESMWEERLTLVEKAPRYIEYVFRVCTTFDDGVLDNGMMLSEQFNYWCDAMDEDTKPKGSIEYIPEGSHWREIDKYDPYIQRYLRRTSV